jgi:predicted Rossmann fold flavoprotein
MALQKLKIAVIGAGAAGYFAAIEAGRSGAEVHLLEKSNKVLSKVKISGGGRCNVTHACSSPSQLVKNYPRGGKKLKKAFSQFAVADTEAWFNQKGVALKTEPDGRMFPVSDSSQTIMDALQNAAQQAEVRLELRTEVQKISPQKAGGFLVSVKKEEQPRPYHKVIVCCGGNPKLAAYQWLQDLDLKVEKPIPSLFTFNVPSSDLKDLQGLSVPQGSVQVPGQPWKQDGPILITHWGFSAPAVIKLSAWQAQDFFACSYQFPILINWTSKDEESLRQALKDIESQHPKKQVAGSGWFNIPARLWQRLCHKAGLTNPITFAELSKKQRNRLIETLVRTPYQVNGKTTFKEEFVTCGGVALSEVHPQTFECKKWPGLFLAGEVLNVDGVTGGFNFQHAWTSGFLAGRNAAHNY